MSLSRNGHLESEVIINVSRTPSRPSLPLPPSISCLTSLDHLTDHPWPRQFADGYAYSKAKMDDAVRSVFGANLRGAAPRAVGPGKGHGGPAAKKEDVDFVVRFPSFLPSFLLYRLYSSITSGRLFRLCSSFAV